MVDDNFEYRLRDLMRSAQDGNGIAYQELLRLSLPIIGRIVKSQSWSKVEADDVIQNILLSLHSVRHTYDPSRPFIPWLASIARHRAVDAHRRHTRIAHNELHVREIPETYSDAPSNWTVEGKGDPELLRRAIADLPAGQRKAVELLRLKELSLREASATSGMSVAALKIAVHRGLKTLRLRLTGNATQPNEWEQ